MPRQKVVLSPDAAARAWPLVCLEPDFWRAPLRRFLAARPHLRQHRDELEAVAEDRYLLAAALFDGGKGVKFTTWAWRVIHHGLCNWQQKRAARPGTSAFTDLERFDARGEPYLPVDPPSREPAPERQASTRELLALSRRCLPAHYWRVVVLAYAEGRDGEDVGRRLGMSRQRVNQILTRARALLRKRLPGLVESAGVAPGRPGRCRAREGNDPLAGVRAAVANAKNLYAVGERSPS